jgi:hypothetical protein
MGSNLDGEMRRQKANLVSQMEELDKKVDKQELHSEEWRYKYEL